MDNNKNSNQVIDETHDRDIQDLINTVEVAKEFLKRGEYDKVLVNLDHVKYLSQYL